MRQQRFRGTHYEVGKALGATLEQLEIPRYSSSRDALVRGCRDLLARLYPPALQQLEGIIDGASLPGDLLEKHYFLKGISDLGCAGFVILPERTRDGEPLVGRAYHWLLADRKWLRLRRTHITGTYATLACTHHWIGLPDCINERGLYCGIFALPGESSKMPALQWHVIVDMVMETCDNTKSAVELILKVPHFRCLGYLLADAEGNAAVLEADPENVQVRGPQAGVIAATNHYLLKDLGTQHRYHSVNRYKRLKELINTAPKSIDMDYAKRILANHEADICQGEHDPVRIDPASSWGTLYALLAHPAGAVLEISPGHPCITPYEQVGFEGTEETQGGV